MAASALNQNSRIFIAGHRGLVGSAILRALHNYGCREVIVRTHSELDLLDTTAVAHFFQTVRPEIVFMAAAKVGGILVNNTYPADFLRHNLIIQNNMIEAAHRCEVQRLLFLGSSCIYPKLAPQPISESSLLSGPLEPTNRSYALAKIAGVEMCWSYNRQYGTRYLAAMPTNLYGPDDNFDLNTSHVLPALFRKAAEARRDGRSNMVVWGTGTPRRELMYSDDLASACLFLMSLDDDHYGKLFLEHEPPLINIGTGQDITIRELALLVAQTVGFDGEVVFDHTRPDGTPRKLLDVSRLHNLGWHHRVSLEEGIARTWEAIRDRF